MNSRNRTLGTLTDTDVKERRTITLGTLTGRLEGAWPLFMGAKMSLVLDCGDGISVTVHPLPAETPVEVRS